MNNYKLPILLFCATLLAPAAGLTQGVTSFISGSFDNGTINMTYSAGEVISGNFSNSTFNFTGGSFGITNLVPTSSEPDRGEYPIQFRLRQNYPNPFNPTTTIAYELPKKATVKIDVYNSIGARVASFDEGQKAPGLYNLKFDASAYASGLYLYRFIADGVLISTKKMTLIK